MELQHNPFFVLGATTRDDRRRLLEISEEAILVADEGVVRQAGATLTHPRKRLSAEVAWLPGLGPKKIDDALSILRERPQELRKQAGLPSLARANLLADGIMRAVECLSPDEIATWIVELAVAHDQLDVDATTTLINEERAVSGFPAVSDIRHVEAELQARRQHYRKALKSALDKLPTATLLGAITATVDHATECGQAHAPILIDDLVDSFEVEAQGFLDEETESIRTLVDQVRAAAERDADEEAIDQLVEQLEKVVKNWDVVAQPIQVSARSRGLSHGLSHEVAAALRTLAVELVNEHGLLEVSTRLTELQKVVFAEVDRIVEQSHEDASAIEELAEQRTEFLETMVERAGSWRKEITYEAEIGVMFKDKLRISPEGVEWKGTKIALDEIQRIRWGGTRHSVNGVPTGTTYSIAIAGPTGRTQIELRKEYVFSNFVDRLWRTAGVRILTEMLKGLSNGEHYRFGSAVVSDYGVELERRHIFAANDRVPCKWTDLVIGNGPGTFFIAKKDERKVEADLSYQDIDNVHVLEAAMQMFWKKASPRLSDLLQSD